MPWPLDSQKKSTEYPLDGRVSGPQWQSGCGGKEKKSLPCPYKDSQSSHPTYSVFTILTELPILRNAQLGKKSRITLDVMQHCKWLMV